MLYVEAQYFKQIISESLPGQTGQDHCREAVKTPKLLLPCFEPSQVLDGENVIRDIFLPELCFRSMI